MNDWAELRSAIQANRAGLYTLSPRLEVSPQDVEQLVEACGYQFLYLDGRTISNATQLISALQVVTHYPYSAGDNWDAIYDHMTSDLYTFLPASGYVLLYDNFQELQPPNRTAYSDTDTALEVLARIAEFWFDVPKMLILLRGDLKRYPSLPGFDYAVPSSNPGT